MSRSDLVSAAGKLSEIIESLDRSRPLLQEAYGFLRPLIDDALAGRLKAPGQLSNRTFFFGMYDNSLPSRYLTDVDFMNALGEFDQAWRDCEA